MDETPRWWLGEEPKRVSVMYSLENALAVENNNSTGNSNESTNVNMFSDEFNDERFFVKRYKWLIH